MTSDSLARVEQPQGSCDCHMHIYDPAAPRASSAPAPGWATLAAYVGMRDRIGISRSVIVQPNAYGADNRVTLRALEQLGGTARGIATVRPSVGDEELGALDRAGIRGLRFHMLPGGSMSWDDVLPMARRIAPLGWHIQVQMDGRLLPDREELLASLPSPVVIDHVGKFLTPVPTDHPGFMSLLRLLDNGRTWLKLSAPYETSTVGPPLYPDVGALAKAAAAAAPERMLWASNWPHVALTEGLPDDRALLDLLGEWIPDPAARKAALVDNPARLYGFS